MPALLNSTALPSLAARVRVLHCALSRYLMLHPRSAQQHQPGWPAACPCLPGAQWLRRAVMSIRSSAACGASSPGLTRLRVTQPRPCVAPRLRGRCRGQGAPFRTDFFFASSYRSTRSRCCSLGARTERCHQAHQRRPVHRHVRDARDLAWLRASSPALTLTVLHAHLTYRPRASCPTCPPTAPACRRCCAAWRSVLRTASS